jgi:NAD(P)-dependent dehydrogenase (short-subunit alcohol dehydrogenase family)
VYGVSRTPPEGIAAEARFRFASLDLRRFDAIPAVLKQLLQGTDDLDLVLLNAGVLGQIKDLQSTSIDELREVMDVNVWSNKVLIDTLLGEIQVSVKQVVAISSGAAFNGSGGWGAYSISKSALNLLVRVYAHEHPGTHFCALAPGIVDTPMIRYILEQPEDPRFAANGRIRAAQRESRVLPPETAAATVQRRVPELLERQSGSYVDIRQM